jgi:hypothetical protein
MPYAVLIGVVAVVAITAVYFVWVRKPESGEQPPRS